MDRPGYGRGPTASLHSHDRFMDEGSCVVSHDVAAEYSTGLSLEEKFDKPGVVLKGLAHSRVYIVVSSEIILYPLPPQFMLRPPDA